MMYLREIYSQWDRFRTDERGAVIVEFAITFPIMLVFFAFMIETARIYWSYQMAIGGVRDATRYMSRVLPLGSCIPLPSPTVVVLEGSRGTVEDIVNLEYPGTNTASVFPTAVTINSVTPTLDCSNADTFRNGVPPIIEVRANLTIQFPLGFIFAWYDQNLVSVTTEVADSARVYGS